MSACSNDSDMREYGEIIRVSPSQDHEVLKRDGYAFVSEHKPLVARQYCREMTLARGRILYEVWDHWTDRFMGNIVPEEVLQEAKAYSQHQGPRSPPSAALRARSTVTSTFPRMPIYSVQQVTEDVTRGSRHRPITNRMIEECVVLHAKWKYTSFEFRLLNVQQKEADIMGIIKPRMREVLQSWLPHYVRAYDLVELWERHGLLDADDGEGKGGNEDLVIRMPSVGYHGGLEMPGNLSTVCGMRF